MTSDLSRDFAPTVPSHEIESEYSDRSVHRRVVHPMTISGAAKPFAARAPRLRTVPPYRYGQVPLNDPRMTMRQAAESAWGMGVPGYTKAEFIEAFASLNLPYDLNARVGNPISTPHFWIPIGRPADIGARGSRQEPSLADKIIGATRSFLRAATR